LHDDDVPTFLAFSMHGGLLLDVVQDDPDNKKEADFDWWSKFYASGNDPSKIQIEYNEGGYDHLKVCVVYVCEWLNKYDIVILTIHIQIFSTELEEQPPYNNFTDFAETFPLYRGKGSRDPDEADGQCCGYLKGAVKVYPLPPDGPAPEKVLSTESVPSTKSEECVIRVYVVRVRKINCTILIFMCFIFRLMTCSPKIPMERYLCILTSR